MKSDIPRLDKLISLAKRRGIVYPASEIYGGLSGFYDLGPYGAEMARKIKDLWWDHFVRRRPEIFGLDSAVIQSPLLWKASGHVDSFHDPMVDCRECKVRFRADQLADSLDQDPAHLDQLLSDIKCPNCGAQKSFTGVRPFNMMLETVLGVASDKRSDDTTYLRPETAGGIFTNFGLVKESVRAKLPFGIAQIGKAFRNEISPRDFLFRTREFEQMEIEYFVEPKTADKEYEAMKQENWNWLVSIGVDEGKMQWYQHKPQERAHYAKDSWDINYHYPFGKKELIGIANRGDYDLKTHSQASGRELDYFDSATSQHIVPYVIEPSLGIGRLMLALLDSAYHEEEVKGEQRTVLRLHAAVAPVNAAVLPLSKHATLAPLAKKIFNDLIDRSDLNIEYDENQSIGKRYRRQDEIGTPLCVTIDFRSIEDGQVTVRGRDDMKQRRVPIVGLFEVINGEYH